MISSIASSAPKEEKPVDLADKVSRRRDSNVRAFSDDSLQSSHRPTFSAEPNQKSVIWTLRVDRRTDQPKSSEWSTSLTRGARVR
jgi:hypothetical protein